MSSSSKKYKELYTLEDRKLKINKALEFYTDHIVVIIEPGFTI